MARKEDTKYLLKQSGIWFFRIKIPTKYQYAFNGVSILKRTTGEKDLVKARIVRDALSLRLKLQFQEIDTGVKAVIPTMARKHFKELQGLREAQLNPFATDSEAEGAEEMISLKQEDILSEASHLLPKHTYEEFNVASNPKGEGGQDILVGIKALDKTGKAMDFIEEALGDKFNSYIDEYIKHRTLWGDTEKKTKAYRLIINTFAKTFSIYNLNKKAVKQWAINRVIEKGYQPDTVITETQFLNNYLEYLVDELEIKWADIKSPFKLKTEDFPNYKKNKSAKDRQAWTMDDMKLVYQADTPQVKDKPELKNLMALGMIYGCRIEEFLQLTVANIVHEENIRCIFIDKSKTDGYHPFGQRYLPIVKRLVPIIDRMIEDKKPDDYLITTASSPNQTRSALIGGTFNRHKAGLGFPRPKNYNFGGQPQQVKDFHSYRKTVNTNLLALGLLTNQRNSICGWGTAFNNKQMAETTYLENKIAYPLVKRKEHLELWAGQFMFSF